MALVNNVVGIRAANSVDFFIAFKFEFSLFYEFTFEFSIFIREIKCESSKNFSNSFELRKNVIILSIALVVLSKRKNLLEFEFKFSAQNIYEFEFSAQTFFEFKFEFGKKIELFRVQVRVRSPGLNSENNSSHR